MLAVPCAPVKFSFLVSQVHEAPCTLLVAATLVGTVRVCCGTGALKGAGDPLAALPHLHTPVLCRVGSLNVAACIELGVKPGRDYARLKGGESVQSRTGDTVHPEQVSVSGCYNEGSGH